MNPKDLTVGYFCLLHPKAHTDDLSPFFDAFQTHQLGHAVLAVFARHSGTRAEVPRLARGSLGFDVLQRGTRRVDEHHAMVPLQRSAEQ